jgi:hypothetical protein
VNIKARLITGEIIELAKDCYCPDAIHIGPHRLYLDSYLRRRIRAQFGTAIKGMEHAGGVIEFREWKAYYFRVERLDKARLRTMMEWLQDQQIETIIYEEQEAA